MNAMTDPDRAPDRQKLMDYVMGKIDTLTPAGRDVAQVYARAAAAPDRTPIDAFRASFLDEIRASHARRYPRHVVEDLADLRKR